MAAGPGPGKRTLTQMLPATSSLAPRNADAAVQRKADAAPTALAPSSADLFSRRAEQPSAGREPDAPKQTILPDGVFGPGGLPSRFASARVSAPDDAEEHAAAARAATVAPSLPPPRGAASLSGGALPDEVRGPFEQALGADLRDVRVHDDGNADALSRALGARAVTAGTDISFRSGELDVASASGRELLAHELTHVVQQREGAPRLHRSFEIGGEQQTHVPDDDLEVIRMTESAGDYVLGTADELVRRAKDSFVHGEFDDWLGAASSVSDSLLEQPGAPPPPGSFVNLDETPRPLPEWLTLGGDFRVDMSSLGDDALSALSVRPEPRPTETTSTTTSPMAAAAPSSFAPITPEAWMPFTDEGSPYLDEDTPRHEPPDWYAALFGEKGADAGGAAYNEDAALHEAWLSSVTGDDAATTLASMDLDNGADVQVGAKRGRAETPDRPASQNADHPSGARMKRPRTMNARFEKISNDPTQRAATSSKMPIGLPTIDGSPEDASLTDNQAADAMLQAALGPTGYARASKLFIRRDDCHTVLPWSHQPTTSPGEFMHIDRTQTSSHVDSGYQALFPLDPISDQRDIELNSRASISVPKGIAGLHAKPGIHGHYAHISFLPAGTPEVELAPEDLYKRPAEESPTLMTTEKIVKGRALTTIDPGATYTKQQEQDLDGIPQTVAGSEASVEVDEVLYFGGVQATELTITIPWRTLLQLCKEHRPRDRDAFLLMVTGHYARHRQRYVAHAFNQQAGTGNRLALKLGAPSQPQPDRRKHGA
jgi:hypothetical protein